MRFHAVCAFLVLALAATVAGAADYPKRNITVVVPFPPDGASDVTARLTSNKLSERIGKSVIIENRAGANGGLGAAGLNRRRHGHANASFQNLRAVAQHIRAGKLKALAVTGEKRAAALPDVPTT